MNEIEQRQKEMISEFQNLPNWEERYKKIIALGKTWPSLPEKLKTEEAKVKGCQSQVWLHAHLSPEGKVQFQGDSDAMIVKGLLVLLLKIYSDATPEEILETPPHLVKDLGFEGNLSPSRANGFFSMLRQIRNFATAFQVLQKSKKG